MWKDRIKITKIDSNFISKNYPAIAQFDCRDDAINGIFKKHIKQIHSVSYAFIDSVSGKIISFVSLCSSAIQRQKDDSLHSLPAIELKLFGVDKNYQHEVMTYENKQVKFSEFTFMWVLAFINNVLKEYIGVEYLILFSVPQNNTLKFYEKMGMSYLTDDERVYNSDFSDGCVPMYLEL